MYHLVIYPWKLYLRVPYCPQGRICFSQICHIICVVNARSFLPYYKSDENISRIIDDIKCEIHALKIGQPGPFLSAYLARNLRIFYEFFKLIKFHTTIQSSHLQLFEKGNVQDLFVYNVLSLLTVSLVNSFHQLTQPSEKFSSKQTLPLYPSPTPSLLRKWKMNICNRSVSDARCHVNHFCLGIEILSHFLH